MAHIVARYAEMGYRRPFRIDPTWTFRRFLQELFTHYTGGGIQSTGYRLNAMRAWMSMAGRAQSVKALRQYECDVGVDDDVEIAKALSMSRASYRSLKQCAASLPDRDSEAVVARPLKVFISYKWEAGAHVSWVRRLAADLRSNGIEALLDQWEVRLGESFFEYMQGRIASADVIVFVITPSSVASAQAPKGKGGRVEVRKPDDECKEDCRGG